MDEPRNKNLSLSLEEARMIYLSLQKMNDSIEKDLMRKKGNEAFDESAAKEKLRLLHSLSNRMKTIVNEFLTDY